MARDEGEALGVPGGVSEREVLAATDTKPGPRNPSSLASSSVSLRA